MKGFEIYESKRSLVSARWDIVLNIIDIFYSKQFFIITQKHKYLFYKEKPYDSLKND